MNDLAIELIVECKTEKWGYALEQAEFWKKLGISRRVCIGMPIWVWDRMRSKNRKMIRDSGIGFLGVDELGDIKHFARPKDEKGRKIPWPSSIPAD